MDAAAGARASGSPPRAPNRTRVYLDWAATAPLRPEALEAMCAVLRDSWGNASSPHGAGRRARAAVERARAQVAGLIHCPPDRLVFTSGGTEANNLAVLGTAALAPERRHVVVSAIEHRSVLDACLALGRRGHALTIVPPDGDGRVPAARVAAALRDDTALCALMLANNEVGALQPVADVGAACRARGVPLLVDAVAAAGKLPLGVDDLGADLLTLSAHKLGGPQGAGALYVAAHRELAPLVHGGGQERRWRPGTENVAAIAAFGVAAELAGRELPAAAARLRLLDARLRAAVLAADCGAVPTGPADPALRVPGVSSFAFPGCDGEALLVALDLLGVAASGGSACTSGSVEPSHVLAAMGLPADVCRAPLRLSLGTGTLESDLEQAVAALREAVRRQGARRPARAAGAAPSAGPGRMAPA
jgi:cysteine desulfurase